MGAVHFWLMAESPAFQFYPGDFMRSTSMWDAIAVGVYIQLLCLQWDQGGIPNDLEKLERAVGKEVREVWEIVGPKFKAGKDGILRNQRLELVRKNQDEYRARIGKARRKAASARWGGESKKVSVAAPIAHPNGNANALLLEDEVEGNKSERKERAKVVSIEDRKALFIAACALITDADPARLLKTERKAFTDYWLEPNAKGKMRFEGEKYFDHGRRMDTWMKTANERSGSRPRPVDTAQRRDIDTDFT